MAALIRVFSGHASVSTWESSQIVTTLLDEMILSKTVDDSGSVDVFGSGAAMDCRQDEQRFLQLGGEVQPGRARWQRHSKVSKPLGSCFPSYQLGCAMYIVCILCINIYICLIILVFIYNIYICMYMFMVITKFHTQDYQQW
jgi:hypothetical protein